jgi:hypothetical protein
MPTLISDVNKACLFEEEHFSKSRGSKEMKYSIILIALKWDFTNTVEVLLTRSWCTNLPSSSVPFLRQLRNHVNIDELMKHDIIPREAGLSNMVKNGRLPY